MAQIKYKPSGNVVGKTIRTIRDQKNESRYSNVVTMGNGVPVHANGKVGDITVRRLKDGVQRAYIKTDTGWRDINDMVSLQKVTWTPMTLLNSWVHFGATTNVPAYCKDSNGFVHLRGMVKNGSAIDAVITTLPAGFRSGGTELHIVWNGTTTDHALIHARSSGDINAPSGGSTSAISLDGITYFAEN